VVPVTFRVIYSGTHLGAFVGLDGRYLRSGAAAVTVAVAAGTALLMGPRSAAAGALPSVPAAVSVPYQAKTVTYLGRDFAVPSSWRVVDLTAHPTACVRFDVHAVYLGQPGAEQQCPARGAGRHTGALLIQPDLTRSTNNVVIALDHRVSAEIDVTAPGMTVTASYGDDRATVLSALAAAGLPQPAADAATAADGFGAAPAHDSAPVEIVRGTNLVTGLGFDTCTAPSTGQMQAWGASPFGSVGVYIGGSERACAQSNLTRGWITARAASGWHFMPLYVGWQAAWDSLTATAPASLGTQSADDAVAQARNLGFGSGALLYYDMESYRTSAQGAAAIAFLSAWTAELHAKGYRSAVYSSASTGIADLVSHRGRMIEPDVVDIAHWNGVADGDPNATPASAWPVQRVHQYLGSITVAYGGARMNIDDDYLSINNPPCGVTPPNSSPTASPSASPRPSPTASPRPSPTASPSTSAAASRTASPTASASAQPSATPSISPTGSPSAVPSGGPVPIPGPSAPASNRLGTC
jgi:hypothetical protein